MQALFNAVDSAPRALVLTVTCVLFAASFFAAKWVKKQKWANK